MSYGGKTGIWMGVMVVTVMVTAVVSSLAVADECEDCHMESTPVPYQEWASSEHADADVSCVACHGDPHNPPEDDPDYLSMPTYETCGTCHSAQEEQFLAGKHSLAWEAMNAMPTAHWQPMELMEGMKGCGGCHKIGVKSPEELQTMKAEQGNLYGIASCDMCHTRHQFSTAEASQPQTCRTCHMGIDHPQWEMYSSSKHGVRYLMIQDGLLPEGAVAPKCQTCHMPEGDHEVRTAWGFLAVRMPLPEDEEWADWRATILKALGALDPSGNPTSRLETLTAIDVARMTDEAWQAERDEMLGICSQCHAERFARAELEKGDALIRQCDELMAEAINIVADLYLDLVAQRPEFYAYSYSDVLTFHDAPTTVEIKLFEMFHKHRMRAFQGAFHNNPDYALWYGWSEMRKDLVEIRELAEEMRREAE